MEFKDMVPTEEEVIQSLKEVGIEFDNEPNAEKENRMNKSLIWAWAIKNSITIIAWTVLAIIFDKWWIAFFAILFI